MNYTIVDCYTDEPAGLGVPPYIGTYPRYIYGKLADKGNVSYLTIDDLRFHLLYDGILKKKHKTDIRVYNRTNKDVGNVLAMTDVLVVVCGVHVPGKYLSALPGTLKEISLLVRDLRCTKILTGPAASEFGTRLEGGKLAEEHNLSAFDEIVPDIVESYDDIGKAAIKGAEIGKQIPYTLIAEIETARGCSKKKGCSFCTEPLKHRLEFRPIKDIVAEVEELNRRGVKHFRLGKQSDFFLWKASQIEKMLSRIRERCNIEVLHIDNIDPLFVNEGKVQLIVKYCTEGNVAALGVETFDIDVIKANDLQARPEDTVEAIRIINKYGRERQ